MNIKKQDRRTDERRSAGERRRQADNRRVYLELGPHELRVLVIVERGGEQKDLALTRKVRFGEGASDKVAKPGAADVAQAIKQAATELRLSGCATTILLSGQQCVTRVATGSKQAVDRELSQLRERTQLYLSLGAGPKTLALGRSDLDARHEHALLSVANARVLRATIDAAEAAGLAVKRVESALVALSRLHAAKCGGDSDPVILLRLEGDGAGVGLLRQGRLLLDYRPSGQPNPEEMFRLLDEHRNRLLRLCQRQVGLSQTKLTRVFTCGSESAVSAASHAARVSPSWQVEPMTPQSIAEEQWEQRDGAMGVEFAALVGSALHEDANLSALPRPNLMDQIIAESRAPIRPILLRSLAPLAATLLLWVAGTVLLQGFESRLEVLREELAELAPLKARSTQLKTELFAADAKLTQLVRLSEQTPDPQLTLALTRIAGCLPGDVWLDQVRVEGSGQTVVGGASYSDSGAYDFVRYLQEAPDLDEVALRGTKLTNTPEGPATSFDVNFTLSPGKPASPEVGT